MAKPILPAEAPYSDMELDLIDNEPPGLFPTNQDSYWGQVRKLFADYLNSNGVDLFSQWYNDLDPRVVGAADIDEWEYLLGVPQTSTTLTLDQRRPRILSRMYRGAFTRTLRQQIVESFIIATFGPSAQFTLDGMILDASGIPLYSGVFDLAGAYQIIENVEAFSYEVRLAAGIAVDQQGLLRELRRVTPAGIAINITSTSTGTTKSSLDAIAKPIESATVKVFVTANDINSVTTEQSNAGFGSSLPAPHPESAGTIFYVSASTGSDSNPGTLAQPWATIDKAMSTLTAGQKAYVRSGSYGLSTGSTRLVWSANGSAGNMISIEAYPGENPVVYRNLRITGTYLRWRGITIDRNAIVAARAGNAFGWDTATSNNYPGEVGIWTDGSNIHIDQTEIRNQRWTGILIGSGSNVQITRCWIHNNGSTHDDHGIYYNGGGTNSLVANCIFERNADFGLQFYPSPSGVILTNCTFAYNGSQIGAPAANPYPQYTSALSGAVYPYGNSTDGAGVIVNSTTSGLKIVNCVAYGNVLYGFRTLGTVTSSQVALFSNCHAHNHPNGGGSGANYDAGMTALGVSLTSGDPKFTAYGDTFVGAVGVSAGPSGFKPLATSPLISGALAAYTPPVDYLGTLRTRADIGAVAA